MRTQSTHYSFISFFMLLLLAAVTRSVRAAVEGEELSKFQVIKNDVLGDLSRHEIFFKMKKYPTLYQLSVDEGMAPAIRKAIADGECETAPAEAAKSSDLDGMRHVDFYAFLYLGKHSRYRADLKANGDIGVDKETLACFKKVVESHYGVYRISDAITYTYMLAIIAVFLIPAYKYAMAPDPRAVVRPPAAAVLPPPPALPVEEAPADGPLPAINEHHFQELSAELRAHRSEDSDCPYTKLNAELNAFHAEFKCPVQNVLMDRPVALSSGATCDAYALIQRLKAGVNTCPVNPSVVLRESRYWPRHCVQPNVLIKNMIIEGLQAFRLQFEKLQAAESAVARMSLS